MGERTPTLVLYSKEDCGLCDEAKEALRPICARFGVRLEEMDITQNPELLARFGEEIPVGFLNGEKVFKYRVESGRLRRLLNKAVREAENSASGA